MTVEYRFIVKNMFENCFCISKLDDARYTMIYKSVCALYIAALNSATCQKSRGLNRWSSGSAGVQSETAQTSIQQSTVQPCEAKQIVFFFRMLADAEFGGMK